MTINTELAFIGTNTSADEDGVFGFRIDDDGQLHRTSSSNGGPAPMFLTSNAAGDRLYVANRPEDVGSVVAYTVDRNSGSLSRLNAASTKGDGTPCYCSIDATGQCVLTAQYGGGTVSLLPVDDSGRVGDAIAVVEHEGSGPNEDRQSEPHPHCILPGPDNEYAYAPDLGADRIFVYDFDPDAGTLEAADCGHIDVQPGAGPRHLEFHPNGRYGYLINELDSTVTAFERNRKNGTLEAFATETTLPETVERDNDAADIHVHPSGDYLYASNRGHDSIAIFELDGDGRPSLIGTESTRGEWPRNFALDPSGEFLFAENADTDNIVSFRIEADGTLEPTGHEITVPSPVCMQFVDR